MNKIKSFFRFEITQTVADLARKIKELDGRDWDLVGNLVPGATVTLRQRNKEKYRAETNPRPDCDTTVQLLGDENMIIKTVSGFEYVIVNKAKCKGAEVSFSGPVNALGLQTQMPRFTYVAGTLMGMDSTMDKYVPITEYMAHRAERHGNNPNPRDEHGWKVNRVFNNELAPWFPAFHGNVALTQGHERARRQRKINRNN